MSEKVPQHNPNSYDALFGRLDEKLDSIAADIRDIKTTNADLSKRVTVLEGFRYYITGVATLCSSAITFVLSFFFRDK